MCCLGDEQVLYLYNNDWRYRMSKKIVQLWSERQQIPRWLFSHSMLGNIINTLLPIRPFRVLCVFIHHGLKCEQSTAGISVWYVYGTCNETFVLAIALRYGDPYDTALDLGIIHSCLGQYTSAFDGTGTRMMKHRLLMGPMMRLDELQQRTKRRLALYFSIVRRRPCCASLLSRSASRITATAICRPNTTEHLPLNACLDLSICWVCASSLIISCTTTRSYIPASLGFNSTWKLLE